MPGLARPTSRAEPYLRVIGETGKVWGSEFTARVIWWFIGRPIYSTRPRLVQQRLLIGRAITKGISTEMLAERSNAGQGGPGFQTDSVIDGIPEALLAPVVPLSGLK